MIRDLKKLHRGGCYVGDFRYDEGVRIREDFISPCLTARNGCNKGISGMVLYVEVADGREEDSSKERD